MSGYETVKYNKFDSRKNPGRKDDRFLRKKAAALHLHFHPKSQVTGITETRNYVAFGGKLVINISAPDRDSRILPLNIFNTNSTGNSCYNMNLFGVTFCLQEMYCLY